MDPKVSAIIPSYNCARYISEAIDSVLSQTYKDFELIVVDNGSTDNTKEVLKKYRDRLIHLFQPKKGPSAARNLGIKHARGEYIAFLDSDDIWLPEKLDIQIPLFDRYPQTGLVGSGCYYIDINGEVISGPHYAKAITTYNDFQISCLFKGSTSSAIVKKECFDMVGLFDETLFCCEDWEMWLRISKYYQVRNFTQPLVMFRVHQTEKWNRTDDIELTSRKKLIEKNVSDKKLRRKAYSWTYFILFHRKMKNRQVIAALKYATKSFLFCPIKISDDRNRIQPFLEMVLPNYVYKSIRFLVRRVRAAKSLLYRFQS